MRYLQDSSFCVSTFIGKEDEGAKYGPNGLPITPASVRILGRFQKLKTIEHPALCRYLDIQRGKNDRVFVVAEHHERKLSEFLSAAGPLGRDSVRLAVFWQVADALAFLHARGITHRYLALDNIEVVHVTENFLQLRLGQYGFYSMTNCGADVNFEIANPFHMAPEIFASQTKIVSGPKVDTWSLGIIMLQIATQVNFMQLWKPKQMISVLERVILKRGCSFSALSSFLEAIKLARPDAVVSLSDELRHLIDVCLIFDPRDRPLPGDLLQKEALACLRLPDDLECDPATLDDVFRYCSRTEFYTPARYRAFSAKLSSDTAWLDRPIRDRPIDEVYYLWKLAGSSVEMILKRKGLIKSIPPIKCIAHVAVGECDMFGNEKNRKMTTDLTVIPLSLSNLEARLNSIEAERFFVSLELTRGCIGMDRQLSTSAQLPINVKERDIEYQLERLILFYQLIGSYPYKKDLLWSEARVDIPPLYRGFVWAALLNVKNDVNVIYNAIDKETPTPTDRQIDVDIPRCHQYDELLSSPEGHMRLKRVLKAWVISHPQYVYWQGLDSLCAPFLYLNFNNEGLAYACLAAFIPRYLHKFFMKDNAAVLQEYLAVFNHLITFHDPELGAHLRNQGFIPELFAIPWFLTMFAHVFPLHKLFHLWDTLLLGDSSFPICVGVAILLQMRDLLMHYGFNECILHFSDLPDIDIERCVTDSVKVFCRTPKTCMYRLHAPPEARDKTKRDDRGGSFTAQLHKQQLAVEEHKEELAMSAIPLSQMKETCTPRMSAEELMTLSNTHKPDKTVLAVDIRSAEEFARGTFPASVNIPFSVLVEPKDELPQQTKAMERLQAAKGNEVIVVMARRLDQANQFAEKLVDLHYSRVCVLHKGIDVFRQVNMLTVPPPDW